MFTCALVLLLLFPVIFLATVLETRFSSNDLAEMGIRLEYSHD